MIRNNQNRRRRSGSGPRPQQLAGGNNYGNRLDNRQRGNASQLLEKYRGLARDSQQAGDRVTAEYYLQYAEHYYRLLGDYRDRQGEPVRRPRDYEDEDGTAYGAAEQDMDSEEDESESRGDSRRERRPEARGEEDRGWRGERQGRDGAREGGRERGDREQAPRARDREWNRDEPRREEGRRDESRRDENRGESRRREDRRPLSARPPVPAEDGDEGPIPGLPGPATLVERSAIAAAPVASGEADVAIAEASTVDESVAEQPAPRKRGRPRKVVAPA